MKYWLLIICWTWVSANVAHARGTMPKDDFRDSVISRIFAYASRYDSVPSSNDTTYTYTKFQMRTARRNFTLTMVPTLYAIAKGAGRQFVGEYYSMMKFGKNHRLETKRLLDLNTVPHRRNIMASMLKYLTPLVYGETLFQDNILSPYHRSNRKFYVYNVTPLPFGKCQVTAYPKLKNTQLVRSMAIVNSKTGKINIVDFEGEYDMTRFYITVAMNQGEGRNTLYPKKCDLRANFRFLGNQITGMYTSIYHLPKVITDSIINPTDTTLMSKVRPIPLRMDEKNIIDKYYQQKRQNDSIQRNTPHKSSFVKDVLWDMVGDNVLNRIKQNFGKENKGYLRINPILNPLYMGYSQRKGFVYKFDVRGSYSFNDDIQLALRFRAGYQFKRHQFYFNMPFILNYNKKHDGFLQIEFGNGNRINSNVIARRILDISEAKDSLTQLPYGDYTDFKDDYLRLTNHWMFNNKFGFEIGLVAHHRSAVNPKLYKTFNFPSYYRSVAPAIALEWHPMEHRGPVIKLDYERSLSGFMKSNISYERMELDAQGIINATRRRSVSLRGGAGFYMQKGDHWYFVDYTNFRDNNIPGGWNDDWSGDFEMLNSEWYNASDYYVRGNVTYESPVLFAAWLPWAGRFIEKERLYVSSLVVRNLHPYSELGYGFTTRLMSIGIFAAFKNSSFRGFGCRWEFELFRNW